MDNKVEATIDLKIGGKYIYLLDGKTYLVMIADVNTHIAIIDFSSGKPIETIDYLNRSKKEALEKCQSLLKGKIIKEVEEAKFDELLGKNIKIENGIFVYNYYYSEFLDVLDKRKVCFYTEELKSLDDTKSNDRFLIIIDKSIYENKNEYNLNKVIQDYLTQEKQYQLEIKNNITEVSKQVFYLEIDEIISKYIDVKVFFKDFDREFLSTKLENIIVIKEKGK